LRARALARPDPDRRGARVAAGGLAQALLRGGAGPSEPGWRPVRLPRRRRASPGAGRAPPAPAQHPRRGPQRAASARRALGRAHGWVGGGGVRAHVQAVAAERWGEETAWIARVAGGRLGRAERLLDPAAARRRTELLETARSVYADPEFDPAEAAGRLLAAAR